MYYISSQHGDNFGVTDTSDGVEEILTDRDIVKLLENKVHIYGTSLYNHKSNSTVLKLDIDISKSELSKLISAAWKLHNPWTMHPIEDYLACVKVGSFIKVHNSEDDTYPLFEKIGIDTWCLTDSDNTISDTPLPSCRIDEVLFYYCCKNSFKVGMKGLR